MLPCRQYPTLLLPALLIVPLHFSTRQYSPIFLSWPDPLPRIQIHVLTVVRAPVLRQANHQIGSSFGRLTVGSILLQFSSKDGFADPPLARSDDDNFFAHFTFLDRNGRSVLATSWTATKGRGE